MKNYLKLIRIHQWIKNLFIFLPLFFSGNAFYEPEKLRTTFQVFLSFSLLTACVYILNDFFDLEKDKQHPTKKNRPLASGVISINNAFILFGCFIIITIINLVKINNLLITLLFATYLTINFLYSWKLKHISVFDVVVIATGFLIRLFIGGFSTDIQLSNWIVLLTFLLSLTLGFGKRRSEFVTQSTQEGNFRSVLKNGYNLEFLNYAMMFCATITVVSFIMFTMSPESISTYGQFLYLSNLFVIVGFLRYLQLCFVFNKTESPSKLVLQDHPMQFILLGWLIYFIILLYVK